MKTLPCQRWQYRLPFVLCKVDYITFVLIVVISDILASRTDKCQSLSAQNTTLVEITNVVYTGDKRLYFRRRAARSHSVTWGRQRRGGVATFTTQGAEGILVEGWHPLSVVFRGLEKPLKLSFVAGNSICEVGSIVGHVEITHEVSERFVSVIILLCTDGLFQ